VLLDVREGWELNICALPGALHIPMGQVPARAEELDPEQELVVICHHGVRSLRVARFRVIYRAPERRLIEIVAIGPRDRIYEETLRLVSAERKR